MYTKKGIHIGKRFGKLIVLEKLPSRKWKCLCDCGSETICWFSGLINGRKTTCGCSRREGKEDITGNKFGRWEVLHPAKKGLINFWICKCQCGTIKTLERSSLIHGCSKSCGCVNVELMRELGKNNFNPNITDEDRRNKRNSLKIKTNGWSIKVLKKDNYKCVVCFNNKKLCTHHKNGWNKFKEERFDIENGVTCCERCHNYFHKVYGAGDNTKEQWQDYLDKISKKIFELPKNDVFEYKYSVKKDDKYGMIKVLKFNKTEKGVSYWDCQCDCGKIKIIKGCSLKNGNTKSCGCARYIKSRSKILCTQTHI